MSFGLRLYLQHCNARICLLLVQLHHRLIRGPLVLLGGHSVGLDYKLLLLVLLSGCDNPPTDSSQQRNRVNTLEQRLIGQLPALNTLVRMSLTSLRLLGFVGNTQREPSTCVRGDSNVPLTITKHLRLLPVNGNSFVFILESLHVGKSYLEHSFATTPQRTALVRLSLTTRAHSTSEFEFVRVGQANRPSDATAHPVCLSKHVCGESGTKALPDCFPLQSLFSCVFTLLGCLCPRLLQPCCLRPDLLHRC